eukprot:TRINITY_DN4823_c1_g1_i1.p1 TRINITY_DN4823_c1_g1~~TRINITY_DN4823_c1_g1_i1.p1  ORF type:complete len:1548 (+),score=450.16 TRINITY_DN4823_c1_g1_i1:440-4645(+)
MEEAAAQATKEAKRLETQIEEQRRIEVETNHREAAHREQLRQHEEELLRLKKNVVEIEKNSEANFKEKLIAEQEALKKVHEQQMSELHSQISKESAAQSEANKQVSLLKESYEEETRRLRQEIQRQREANEAAVANRIASVEQQYKENSSRQQSTYETALQAAELERKQQLEASIATAEHNLKLKYEGEKDRALSEYESQRLQLERKQQELEAKYQHSELQNTTEILKLKQELLTQKKEQEQALAEAQTRLLEQQAEEDQKTKDMITRQHDTQLRQARSKFELEREAESKKAESEYVLQVRQAEHENLIRTKQLQEREVELQNLILKTEMESEMKITTLRQQLTSIHGIEREEYTIRQDINVEEGLEFRRIEGEMSNKSNIALHNEKVVLEHKLLQMKLIGQLEQTESSIRHSIATEQEYEYLSLSKHTEVHHISKAKSLSEEKALLEAQLATLKETNKLEGDEQQARSCLLDEETTARSAIHAVATPDLLSTSSLAHEKAQLESQLVILKATSQLETEEHTQRQDLVNEQYLQFRTISSAFSKTDSTEDMTLLIEQNQQLENALAEAKLIRQLETDENNGRQQLLLDEGLLFTEEIITLDATIKMELSQPVMQESHATSTTSLYKTQASAPSAGPSVESMISSKQEQDEVLKVISVLKKYHGPFVEAENNYRSEILRAEKTIWDTFIKQTADQKSARVRMCARETEGRRELSLSENSKFTAILQFWKEVNKQFSNALAAMMAHQTQARNELMSLESQGFSAIMRYRKSEAADRLSMEELETNARAIIIREQFLGMQRVGQLGQKEQKERIILESAERKPRIQIAKNEATAWSGLLKQKHLAWKDECRRKRDFQKSQWVQNAEGCEECAARFGIFRRKHHCRSCAGVYCNACSKNRTSLPAWGYDTKVRVCESCIKYHNWKRDSDSPACYGCGSFFTIIKRRHHCRSCGEIYCNECTRNKTSLLDLGHLEPQRVCETCYKGEQAFIEHRGNSWMSSPTGMSLRSWSELDLCADDASCMSTPKSLASHFDPGTLRLAEEFTERRKRSSFRLQQCNDFHFRRRGSKGSPILYGDIMPPPTPSPFPVDAGKDSEKSPTAPSPDGVSQNGSPVGDKVVTISDVTDLIDTKYTTDGDDGDGGTNGNGNGIDHCNGEVSTSDSSTDPLVTENGIHNNASLDVDGGSQRTAEVTEPEEQPVQQPSEHTSIIDTPTVVPNDVLECVVVSAVASAAVSVDEIVASESVEATTEEDVSNEPAAPPSDACVTEEPTNDNINNINVITDCSEHSANIVSASDTAVASVVAFISSEVAITEERNTDTDSETTNALVAAAVAVVGNESVTISVENSKLEMTSATVAATCAVVASHLPDENINKQPSVNDAAKPRPKIKKNKPAPKGKKGRGGRRK